MTRLLPFRFCLSCLSLFSLLVPVPPIIEPFSFQDGLSEGMRTRTVCGVSRGDPPLAVSWLKDGQPLPAALGVNVSALDPYSSLLSISSLAQLHSGDFTCVASNPAAEVRYTAKLQVKGNVEPIYIYLVYQATASRPYNHDGLYPPPPPHLCSLNVFYLYAVAFGTRLWRRCDWNPSNVWLLTKGTVAPLRFVLHLAREPRKYVF